MFRLSLIAKLSLMLALVLVVAGCSAQSSQESQNSAIGASQEVAQKRAKVDYKNMDAEIRTFSKEIYEEDFGRRPMVLFFHADWCPTCVWIEENIKKDLSSYPKGTNILIVDFDSQVEMKQKYGIFVQSVLVVLNADGKMTQKLAAPDNEKLISAISESL